MSNGSNRRGSPLTIRKLARWWLSGLVLLTLVGVGALAGSSAALKTAMDAVSRDVRSAALAHELEAAVLMHQRLSNLLLVTGEAGIGAARDAILASIEQDLQLARELVGAAEEQQRLDSVAHQFTIYLAAREQAEQGTATLDEVVHAARGALADVLAELRGLRELNDAQVAHARAAALQMDRWATWIGVSAAILLISGFVVIAWGVRRHVLRPVVGLHEALARYRDGDADARAGGGGVREVDELARMFDEMADSLAQQRKAQLTYLAGVAHDLKSPLSTLKTGMYSLEYEASEPRRGKTRAILDRQIDLLTRMVDDLLDATRIEAGDLELRRAQFDLRPLVREVVALFAPTAPNHALEARLPAQRIVVDADGLRLEQVLRNLVSNAIKYSPEGGSVEVGVEGQDGEAVLYVSDNGVGIPDEDQQSIFLPFRRRRFNVAPGAGLGLSVVRRIVAAHGGRIQVESTPGAGSTFTITLPAVTGACHAAR